MSNTSDGLPGLSLRPSPCLASFTRLFLLGALLLPLSCSPGSTQSVDRDAGVDTSTVETTVETEIWKEVPDIEEDGPGVEFCAPDLFTAAKNGRCYLCNETGDGVTGAGEPIDDADLCTDDLCDPEDGVVHTHNLAPCDDGDPMTLDDACFEGVCQGLSAQVCTPGEYQLSEELCVACSPDGLEWESEGPQVDDDNVCTDDGCDPAVGAVHAHNTVSCDDGDPDTIDDVCFEGVCGGVPLVCLPGEHFEQDGGCLLCNDNGTAHAQGQIVDDGNPCTDDQCSPDSGVEHQFNSLPCDDGADETVNDTCQDGDCIGTVAACVAGEYFEAGGQCFLCNDAGTGSGDGLDLDDLDPCTDDVCLPETGVAHGFNEAPCDDADPSTSLDSCSQGVCSGSTFCIPGRHFEEEGLCQLCTGDPEGEWLYVDTVDASTDWVPASASVDLPADAVMVRVAHILPGTGWLETDSYSVMQQAGGEGFGNLVPNPSLETPSLDDPSLPAGWESESWGTVVASFQYPVAGFDGDKAVRVEITGGDEGDGKWWSEPFAVVPGGGPFLLENHYRSDSQTDRLLLVFDGGTGTVGPGTAIDDANPCTNDGCNYWSGVFHDANSAECDDGDPDTINDQCSDGLCLGQAPLCPPGEWVAVSETWCVLCDDQGTEWANEGVLVDDDEPCTDDLCQPAEGVVHVPIAGDCWDDDLCTENDICADGKCVGVPISCDDYSPCTADTCQPDQGCLHEALTGPCDDGIPLTLDDVCVEGVCIGILDPDADGIPNHGAGPLCNGPGLLEDCIDNCPYDANPSQVDANDDGTGDACALPHWWGAVETTEKVVALTFDDGWHDGRLRSILETLHQHNAYATFFITGVNIQEQNTELETMFLARSAGHQFGNHTFNHSVGTTTAEAVTEINLNEQFYVDHGLGTLRPLFRLPAPDLVNPQLWVQMATQQTGFSASVLANIDTIDWMDPEPPADGMVACILEQVEPGDIISMHAGPEVTAVALPQIVAGLKGLGYELVTVQQLVSFGETAEFIPFQPESYKSCAAYY